MKEFTPARPGRNAYPESTVHAPNAALLIDFDNVTMGIRSDLQSQLRKLLQSDIFKGKVSVQRAYADWRRYPQYIVPLSEASIDLIFAPAFGSNKKNATDIRLAIDALELVFTRPEIGTFILLSGDSDFSSLVLKLKEYGKFVIGIGIRESSSDLLIQNCDEYYSYNELTGLAREGDVEHLRRDPWDLVVTALTQMRQNSDVMRSDRLKQVMQEIDPNFDEKDVGFNRFSKFVTEASQRGLIRLMRLDNGQYEVDLGPHANVAPGVEAALPKAEVVRPSGEDRAGDGRGRRRGGRGRTGRDRAERPGSADTLSLADAFELLQRALLDLGAVGEESTDEEQVRERMTAMREGRPDPIFESGRFHRFLRQAHDAEVVELVKQDGDAYLVKLRPEAVARGAAESQPPSGEVAGAPPAEPSEPESSAAESRPGRRPRGGRGGRGGRRRGTDREPERPEPPVDEAPRSAGTSADSPPPERGAQGQTGRPPLRFRSGSRRPPRPPAPPPASPAPETPPAPVIDTGPDIASRGRRSLRPRSGSRGPASGGPTPSVDVPPVEKPASSQPPAPSPSPAEPRVARGPAAETSPASRVERAAAGPSRSPAPPAEADHTEPSLLKRMTAALQRAVLGEQAGPDQTSPK